MSRASMNTFTPEKAANRDLSLSIMSDVQDRSMLKAKTIQYAITDFRMIDVVTRMTFGEKPNVDGIVIQDDLRFLGDQIV